MIKLNKVNKYYNYRKKNEIHVINNTSLEFDKTGLVALLGPSGCGKTTLLNAIGGLDNVRDGEIIINGQKITNKMTSKVDKVRNLSIGYIFQNFNLIDDMTVFDNVALVLKMIGIKDQNEIKSRVNYVLETIGIYRYRNRLASMLSGGERQRVGIARAIVKNPDIILADEPTGNLDSKNTIEIMNIIKSISKDKLVLLVTHEKDIAHFYASRVIELVDGKVDKDYVNDHSNDLDYQIENKIYLKDLSNNDETITNNYDINYYGNNKDKIKLDIVVVNNNIYIKSNSNEKVEVITNSSNIELVDDHYKKITKKDYEKYNFDLTKLDNSKFNVKYTSIYNMFNLFKTGVKKIMNYSPLKKLLLLGFFISGMFILFGISNMTGVSNVEDKDFIQVNRDYIKVKPGIYNASGKLLVEEYQNYEKIEGTKYIMPGDSLVNFTIKYDDYYQVVNTQDNLSGSLSSINIITEEDLIFGRLPENNKEFVVDKFSLEKVLKNYTANQIGLFNVDDFLNREFIANQYLKYTLVGITDSEEPNIYVSEEDFINILYLNQDQYYYGYNSGYGVISVDVSPMSIMAPDEQQTNIFDYNLVKEDIKLKRGRYPLNDYEVIVEYSNRYIYPLNKTIDVKVNGVKLKVVGYYEEDSYSNALYVNNNTIKYELIGRHNEITLMPEDKTLTLTNLRDYTTNITETYQAAKNAYVNERSKSVASATTVSIVILAISFIEIFLLIRSSFLSRIKEVGTLRAIGMKKRDIYKMFSGEIIVITSTASMLGIAFMTFVIDRLKTASIFDRMFMLNPQIVLLSIVLIYIFNLVVGLIPVFNTIKKTPASILSRTDVD